MAVFRIERFTPLPAAEAWRRVTDWERHGDSVPLTAVTVRTDPPTRSGTVFVARTGLGPLGFDDPMEVVRWIPPAAGRAGLCELEKRGSLVRGRACIDVCPTGSGSHVIWVEELWVRLLPRGADPLLASGGRRVFGRVLDTLLAD
ncbi:MAG TPA: Immediate-early protein 2 [Streptomyces sp.]|uniref:SRPBCC family protein n=1 Tax=Streptomyces salyersiae TaxID=3075530 RepID=A0ABU2RLR7_9ACTN|nr:SRPBCC family protein [Streptomyces sp. DSM 41770]MDT0429796.1 SRPBCC family protein [Streptomyces sp. DSM 41770]HBF83680.1 Immediate-early protein 2 [Streptomyces sp.]